MKELRIILFSICIIVLYSSCLADLRPKSLSGDGKVRNQQASIALLRTSKTHGYSKWSRFQNYECVVRDTFEGFIGKRGCPYAENQVTLKAKYHRGTKDGAFEIVTGKEMSHRWSYNNGQSAVYKNDSIIRKPYDEAEFWVPTYQYFIEFPFRIIEATALELLDDKERNGKTYKRILASWQTTEAQKNIDQYIIWINDDMMIDYIEFTIRDQFKFLKGSAEYVEYNVIDDVFFPSKINIYSSLTGKKVLHHISVSDVKILK